MICVWCGEVNVTPLLLCPSCDERAAYLRQRRGEPIRHILPVDELVKPN